MTALSLYLREILRVSVPLSKYRDATCKLHGCCKVETWVTSGHHLTTLRLGASDLSFTNGSNALKAVELTMDRLVVQVVADSG